LRAHDRAAADPGGTEELVSREPIHKEATGRCVVVVDVAEPGKKHRQVRPHPFASNSRKRQA